jgi:PAS domain S-box-containing protein
MSLSFQNISIRYKITIMVMIACTITLATGFTIALRNDINLLRKDFEDLTSIKAKLIGEYSIAALLNHDKEGCKKILETGTSAMDYISIELYDENGDIFTKLGDAVEKTPSHIRLTTDSAVYVDNKHELKLSHVIEHNNHIFGYIILHTTTDVLEKEIRKDIQVLMFAALVIILIGGFLIYYAQRAITQPIYRLTNYLSFVAENSNTTKTIPVKRKDEIGSIYVAINKLLKTIQKNAVERDDFFATIQKNNDKLGRTLDAFSDGHWEYDIAADIWNFSDAWLNTFGYKRSAFDFSNIFWEKLIHPDDFEIYNQNLNDHLSGKNEYFESEFRLLGKKGGYRWVHFKGHWVEKEGDLVTDMLGITIDIQDKKELERSVIASNKRMVNETKLKAVGNMVSGISHSLKNLLSPIYGYADFGLMTISDNDQLVKELEIIKSSSQKADDIIEDMLTFAGVENVSKTRIDIVTIVKGLLANWHKNSKSISFSMHTNLKFATILGDHQKISQALNHIYKNAYESSFDGGDIDTVVEYLQVDKNNRLEFDNLPIGEYVLIKIQDNGEGIEESDLGRVFEPFFTSKNVGEGVGLGLSVVKGVVNGHEGNIILTSEQYKGTLVQIILPTL